MSFLFWKIPLPTWHIWISSFNWKMSTKYYMKYKENHPGTKGTKWSFTYFFFLFFIVFHYFFRLNCSIFVFSGVFNSWPRNIGFARTVTFCCKFQFHLFSCGECFVSNNTTSFKLYIYLYKIELTLLCYRCPHN